MENNNRNNFEAKNRCLLNAFTENSCANEKDNIVEDRKSLSVYNVVTNEDGSEGIGSLVAEFDYTKKEEEPNKKIIITEEQTQLYKDISQHLLEKGLINFTDNTTEPPKRIYKPENSPAPNWKKINFNKKRYKR